MQGNREVMCGFDAKAWNGPANHVAGFEKTRKHDDVRWHCTVRDQDEEGSMLTLPVKHSAPGIGLLWTLGLVTETMRN